MMKNSRHILHLRALRRGLPGITPEVGAYYEQAARVCLQHANHRSLAALVTTGLHNDVCDLKWYRVGDRAVRSWADLQEATEYGATAIAFLLVVEFTAYTIIERSRKGTGFDYWLGDASDTLPFAHAARLEVSGILEGNAHDVERRASQKVAQIGRSGSSIPSVIVVVEFGTPAAKVVQK